MSINPKAVAGLYEQRLRAAAQLQPHERALTESVALDNRRWRVVHEMVRIDAEMDQLSTTERRAVEDLLVGAFADDDIPRLIKEAHSVKQLGGLDSYWSAIFRALGLR